MKTFFTVKQNDDTECYSGRFNISNDDLDISVDGYDLEQVIAEFISEFKSKYYYWHNIYDADLNKQALIKSSMYMSYEYAYAKC